MTAEPQVVCFPAAATGASLFRDWRTLSGGRLDVLSVELPGRGRCYGQPPFASVDEAVTSLVAEHGSRVRPGATIFGHSLGALLAFEFARALAGEGVEVGVLVASGCLPPPLQVPSWPGPEATPDLLRGFLVHMAGTDAALLENEEFLEIVLDVLRADLALADSYSYRPGPPLPCPIVGIAGTEDVGIDLEVLAPWGDETVGGYRGRLFPGGHLFLRSNPVLVDWLVALVGAHHRAEPATPAKGNGHHA